MEFKFCSVPRRCVFFTAWWDTFWALFPYQYYRHSLSLLLLGDLRQCEISLRLNLRVLKIIMKLRSKFNFSDDIWWVSIAQNLSHKIIQTALKLATGCWLFKRNFLILTVATILKWIESKDWKVWQDFSFQIQKQYLHSTKITNRKKLGHLLENTTFFKSIFLCMGLTS